MNSKLTTKISILNTVSNLLFENVFYFKDIQRIQDLFSDVSGEASYFTYPDGTPINNPGNYYRLCEGLIRKTKKHLQYATHS